MQWPDIEYLLHHVFGRDIFQDLSARGVSTRLLCISIPVHARQSSLSSPGSPHLASVTPYTLLPSPISLSLSNFPAFARQPDAICQSLARSLAQYPSLKAPNPYPRLWHYLNLVSSVFSTLHPTLLPIGKSSSNFSESMRKIRCNLPISLSLAQSKFKARSPLPSWNFINLRLAALHCMVDFGRIICREGRE